MLAGLTDLVVLALDADRAGADAMIRAQKVAGGRGLELRVAAMPEGEDPADMLQEGAVERFMELVEGAVDLPSFRVDVALGRGELGSLAGRERVLEEVGPVLKAMGETALGFDELVRKVADRLDTDPSLVLARVRSAPGEAGARARMGAGGPAPRPVAVSLTPRETRERALLAMCIVDPGTGRQFIERADRRAHVAVRRAGAEVAARPPGRSDGRAAPRRPGAHLADHRAGDAGGERAGHGGGDAAQLRSARAAAAGGRDLGGAEGGRLRGRARASRASGRPSRTASPTRASSPSRISQTWHSSRALPRDLRAFRHRFGPDPSGPQSENACK